MRHKLLASLLVLLTLGLTGCRDEATLPVEAGTGADPKLPPPKQRLIPTVDVAHAVGWPQGATPRAASGFAVKAFANGLARAGSMCCPTAMYSSLRPAPLLRRRRTASRRR